MHAPTKPKAIFTMIKDAAELNRVQKEWTVVSDLRDRIKVNLFAGFGLFGHFSHFLADCANNLPFLHACSVLNEALLQVRDEGVFQCKTRTLGNLVEAAQHQISWVNYSAVTKMVEKRNDLAHRAALLPRVDCWGYLDVIEAELRSWYIIE